MLAVRFQGQKRVLYGPATDQLFPSSNSGEDQGAAPPLALESPSTAAGLPQPSEPSALPPWPQPALFGAQS